MRNTELEKILAAHSVNFFELAQTNSHEWVLYLEKFPSAELQREIERTFGGMTKVVYDLLPPQLPLVGITPAHVVNPVPSLDTAMGEALDRLAGRGLGKVVWDSSLKMGYRVFLDGEREYFRDRLHPLENTQVPATDAEFREFIKYHERNKCRN